MYSRRLYNNRPYYAIAPPQVYWVDTEISKSFKEDNPSHGVVLIQYKITGALDIPALEWSLYELVKRHESLRSTFHNLDGAFYLRVEAPPQPESIVSRFDRTEQYTPDQIDAILDYHDHSLDLERGPLFFARLVKIGTTSYLLSLKTHHVVYDWLSRGILLRDLYMLYLAAAGEAPAPAPLDLQYRDFLEQDKQFALQHHARDRQYWTDFLSRQPGKIAIPCPRNRPEKLSDLAKPIQFNIPADTTSRLQALAREFSASLFIVLQASFKAFLFQRTGQKELLISTQVFGRSFPGAEEQIGCYAYTVLILTILDGHESFSGIINKVKKSNNDARSYRAYTLHDAIRAASPGLGVESVCNVSIQYNDLRLAELGAYEPEEPPPLEIDEIIRPQPWVMSAELQMMFNNRGETIDINVDYNCSLFDEATIITLYHQYIQFLPGILQNPVAAIQEP